jgi:Na+/melibiose symporter-like transporter
MGSHAIVTVASIFLVPVYASLWSDNKYFQWFMTACIVAILVIAIWIPSVNAGIRDFMHDEIVDKNHSDEKKIYSAGSALAAGILSQVPALILLALCFVPHVNFLYPPEFIVRGWYFMFKRFFDTWPNAWMLIASGGALLVALSSTLGYLRGKEMRIRTKIVIARNDAKRIKKKPHNR